MLRVSVTTRLDGTTITLEGRVIGAWVDELTACWRRVLGSEARSIAVDLDGVTFIDDSGKRALRAMHAEGAVLTATTVMMRAIIDEIAAGSPPDTARQLGERQPH